MILVFLSGCAMPAAISKYLPGQKAAPAAQEEPRKPLPDELPLPETNNANIGPSGSAPTSTASAPAVPAKPLTKEEAYKGVVKIKTLVLDKEGFLVEYSQGSGVLIDDKGTILTNSHVVTVESEFDGSDKEVALEVCLTASMNEKPDCSYLAKLKAKDKDLDMALLELGGAIGGAAEKQIPYLELAATNTVKANDEITALGYPGIGEDTITMTKGIASGQTDKYGKTWIKTDAVISFGNSGGAAIDTDGKVLGITTMGYADMLGSLGYIVSVVSINDWIKANLNNLGEYNTGLSERAQALIKRQKQIGDSNSTFSSDYPNFSIAKPSADWDFVYQGENLLQVVSKRDQEKSGAVVLELTRHPYLLSGADIMPAVKNILMDAGALQMIKINKDEETKINGWSGRLVTMSAAGRQESMYYFPVREYLLSISYSYGENDKDKAAVDGIIGSLKIADDKKPFNEDFYFSSADPALSFSSIKNWPIITYDEKGSLALIKSKSIKEASISFDLEKLDDKTKGQTNEEKLASEKEIFDYANQVGRSMDFSAQMVKGIASAPINEEIKSAVRVDAIAKKLSTGEVIDQATDYYIKLGDKYWLDVSLNVLSKDKKVYQAALLEFEKIVKTLSLKAAAADSDGDGLSDAEEAGLGTAPNNPDTDGDGYYDGSELANGYNPLKK